MDSLEEYRDPEDGQWALYGATVPEESLILINAALSGPSRISTKLHETLHAVLATSGLSQLLDHETEEALVTCLEHYLVDKINHRKV